LFRYVVPRNGYFDIKITYNWVFNIPNVYYIFQIYRNNIVTPIAGVSLQNANSSTFTTNGGGNFVVGDVITLVGRNLSMNPYNFDCDITMEITGRPIVPYHLDNTTVMLVKPDKKSSLKAGTILSFQNPELSKDPNVTGGSTNVFGTNGITGASINNGTPNNPAIINVTWARPEGDGFNNTTTYLIDQVETDAQYAKYPMDIEYFQVITAITVGDYFNLHSPVAINNSNYYNERANSLRYRILDNVMQINILKVNGHCWDTSLSGDSPRNINPLTCYEDYLNQVIVIMNRGVDPYSSRGEIEYDLSILFGFLPDSNGAPRGEVVVRTNNYKLNIPIQNHYACARHDSIANDVTQADPNIGLNLYYPSYHFRPSVGQFSGFTSELPSYYLSLSKDYLTPPLDSIFVGSPSISGPCDLGTYTLQTQNSPNYGYLKLKYSAYYGSNFGPNDRKYNDYGNSFMLQFSRDLTPSNNRCKRYGHIFNRDFELSQNRGYYRG
jgi:hypothetical protein